MSEQLCVGIDISAEWVTMTWGTTLEDEHPVLEFEQNAIGHRRLMHQLTQDGYAPQDCLVVMEATGTYWMRLAHTLHDAGFVVSVVNPLQAHHLAQAQLQRAKTDQIDARLLMQLAFRLQPTPWSPPPPVATVLYQCLCQRDALLNTRTQERNRVHALRQSPEVFATILDRYEAHITFLNQQVEALDQEIQKLLQSDPQWADAAHYLLSIKGIGPITTAWLLVATLNFTTCQTPEQLVAFAGLAPYRRQSGARLSQSRRIGHGGHARLRTALYMAAVAAVRSNPRIRQFYQRLLERGKSKKTALCACARKLIHIAWAVVTKQSVFDPTYDLLKVPALSLS